MPFRFDHSKGSPVLLKAVKLDLTLSADDADAAGVYTATIAIPAATIITDVGVHAVALWNAGTSATLNVGDADTDGIFAAFDMKATDLLAGEGITLYNAGGKGGADVSATHWNAGYLSTARNITFVLTTVGTAPTTGETICWVQYAATDNDGGTLWIEHGTYLVT